MSTDAQRAADGGPPAGADARNPALDGVRGMAIVLVMLFHFVYHSGIWAYTSASERVLWKITGAGWAGVDLFFVLSGFLITGILYDAKAKAGHYFRSFYARRVLRIFPLYYIFLLLLIVGLPIVYPDARSSAESVWHGFGWYGLYLTNMHSLFDSSFRPEGLFAGHLWSLAVEEQFYLVWPFVVLLLPRRALMAVCVAAIACAFGLRLGLELAGAAHSVSSGLTPARMDTLAVGALIALAARHPGDLRLLTRCMAPLALAGLGGLIALGLVYGDMSPPLDTWEIVFGLSAVAFLFGGLLLAVISARPQGAL